MKAIINVRKGSSFERHNGQEFDVDLTAAIACAGKLIIPIKGVRESYPNNYTDFSQDELIFKSK
jgi:hypothetical protein